MKIAIMESIMTPGGHEVDFDRILVEELQAEGHEVCFYVPENFVFSFDYRVPVEYINGEAITYTGVRGIQKWLYSCKREINRQKWYREMMKRALKKEFDAIIVPTSTYRYLRALDLNVLKNSPVPVIFILHGINPGEAPKFFKAVKKLSLCRNIKMVVLTFSDSIFGKKMEQVFPIYPPVYTARDLAYLPKLEQKETLTIGFFGQYRREKKLEDFLNVFVEGQYKQKIKLLVQGSTIRPEDSEDFERIIEKYNHVENIEFLHKGLIGAEWQRAIADIDALLMPYSAPRYLYHWGGMLFTAIGFHKPVIVSDDINPEVIRKYRIGESFKSGDLLDLKRVLEDFVNRYNERLDAYRQGIEEANRDFSPQGFIRNIVGIMETK